jgi:uncharacterized protein
MIYSLFAAMAGVLFASILRGFTGFGFGLASVPLLSLVLPPAEVVPLVVTLQVVIGLGGIRAAWRHCDWRAVWALVPGLVCGVPIGLVILTLLPPNPVRFTIGAVIAFSVWLIQRGVRMPPNPSWIVSSLVGLVSGVVSGLASMGGPPVVVYMLALGHTATRMRATAIIYFMLAGVVSFIPMAATGLITRDILVWTAASLPVLFVGSRVGTWAFHRAKPHHHRMVALATLSVLAILLTGRALIGSIG